jgi:hypothetical protein
MRIAAGLWGLLLLASFQSWAGPKPLGDEAFRDAREYLEAVTQAKDLSVDDQVELWRRFLNSHPQSTFRDEIETNMKSLDEFMLETNPVRKREQRESEKYLRAVEYSKKLAPGDRIDLWEQYLEENPSSLYRKEILQRLEGLRSTQKKPGPRAAPVRPGAGIAPARAPLMPDLPFKNAQTAILLATFPGLLVPGIGHWYTRDYALAGILTGCRVAGLAVGIPGVISGNSTMIVAGAIIAGFSYLVDIADAPFTVARYNDALEDGAKQHAQGFSAGLNLSFNF